MIRLLPLLALFVAAYGRFPDWLLTRFDTPSTVSKSDHGTLLLANGLITREFSLTPDFTTIEYYSHEQQASMFRALLPEAIIGINGQSYFVGFIQTSITRSYMNRTALKDDFELCDDCFHFNGYDIAYPVAPFPYTPMRGAPSDIVWPPKGIRLDVYFIAPSSAPALHKQVTVVVHYEMYDGVPAMSKWVSAVNSGPLTDKISFSVYSVESLAVNQQWTQNSMWDGPYNTYKWFYVTTDQSHGTDVQWTRDPLAFSPGAFAPMLNCTYDTSSNPVPQITLDKNGFQSFKCIELVIGSSDEARQALARNRLFRLLAPHTQENPIFFHLTEADSKSMHAAVDQMVEVGFEMLIYSFGSGFDLESVNATYIDGIRRDILYANSKGIEVGGYDLICLDRSELKFEWLAVDKNNQSIGDACFASSWYDYLLDKVLNFMDKTNLTMLETDGPYGGEPCASTEHAHHEDFSDSIYQQQRLQGEFFKAMRMRNVYINQPDNFFYQGGSKTGLGYNEDQYSLPRWEDITISRQSVYDRIYNLIPTAGWMFVPLTVYHSGGAAAQFEPLAEHLQEYEFALAQYLGAGVAACYRGPRLYDTDETKALVKKWVTWYKKYRDILTSDIVRVRRPDMQGIDSIMHVNPKLANRGLAMVFNPTDDPVNTTLPLPLYYTGVGDRALISQQEGDFVLYSVGYNYEIELSIALPPRSITWYLIRKPSDA